MRKPLNSLWLFLLIPFLIAPLAIPPEAHAQDAGYYARQTYTSTGGATYAVPFPYFLQSDIQVTDNGVAYTGTVTFPTTNTLSLSPVIAAGDTVQIKRVTNKVTPKATFNGGPLASYDLNRNQTQDLYLAQELGDATQGLGLPALTGDITAPAGSGITTLATVNANVGTFGSSTLSPVLTVNAKGLITGVTTATIAGGSSGATSTAQDCSSTYASQILSLTCTKTNGTLFGTAATANLGTSGGTVPLLSGTNTWSGVNTFSQSPIIPTASVGDNSTKAASTAFVLANNSSVASSCPSIMAHGGNAGGTVDNTAAYAATIAASPSGQACVSYPPGTFLFNSPMTTTFTGLFDALTIKGSGVGVTKFLFPMSSGIVVNAASGFNSNAVHLDGFTVLGGTTGSAVNGIKLSNLGSGLNTNLSTISNVSVQGADTLLGSDYFLNAVNLVGWSQVTLANVTLYGTGTTPHGYGLVLGPRTSGGTATITEIVIGTSGLSAYGVLEGVQYGSGVQGVSISGPNCNFTGVNYGVHVLSGGTALDQLIVQGCQIAANNVGVFDSTGVTNTIINGNYFLMGSAGGSSASVGVQLDLSNAFSITGNTFNIASGAPPTAGILVNGNSGSRGGVITANYLYGLTSEGIYLFANSQNVDVGPNNFNSVSTPIVNLSSFNNVSVSSCSGVPTSGFTVAHGIIKSC